MRRVSSGPGWILWIVAASVSFAGLVSAQAEDQNSLKAGKQIPGEAPLRPEPPTDQPLYGPGGVPSMGDADQPLVDGWMHLTHGVASGDVTSHGAVLWARASVPCLVHARLDTDPRFSHPLPEPAPQEAREAEDYTATVSADNLQPNTVYYYRVWLTRKEQSRIFTSKMEQGNFKTAPDSTQSAPVTFVWGSDLGGDHCCRRAGKGYEIFSRMGKLAPDFFLAAGDMIYADDTCPVGGPDGVWENNPGDFPSVDDPAISWTDAATVRDIFWAHWQYNRADRHLQKFLATTPMYCQWGDHDVVHDFGAAWANLGGPRRDRPGLPDLVVEGRDAFLQYAPIQRNPGDPNRIYRSFRWGKDLELFLLDTRSYRSRNDLPDTPENRKTMLGQAQLDWLRQGLLRSTATWKVISTDVPISVPMPSEGPGRDAWASGSEADSTGFEQEILGLLRVLDAHQVKNLIFVTGGLRWPAEIRYAADFDGDGHPLIHYELAAGPLSAGRDQPASLDPTLVPKVLYSEGGLFNFGFASVQQRPDGKVHLVAEIVGEDGKVRPGSILDLPPQ